MWLRLTLRNYSLIPHKMWLMEEVWFEFRLTSRFTYSWCLSLDTYLVFCGHSNNGQPGISPSITSPILYILVCTDNPVSFGERVFDNPPGWYEIYFNYQVCSLFHRHTHLHGVSVCVAMDGLWVILHGITHFLWLSLMRSPLSWMSKEALTSELNQHQTDLFLCSLLRPVLSHFHAFSKGLQLANKNQHVFSGSVQNGGSINKSIIIYTILFQERFWTLYCALTSQKPHSDSSRVLWLWYSESSYCHFKDVYNWLIIIWK